MAKYRKKPIEVEAYRLPANWITDKGFASWRKEVDFHSYGDTHAGINIKTNEGVILARPGDWIIKGSEGEFYTCPASVFARIYELAERLIGEVKH